MPVQIEAALALLLAIPVWINLCLYRGIQRTEARTAASSATKSA